MREIYSRCMELSYLSGVKTVQLVDRTDLFKIGNCNTSIYFNKQCL